LQNFVEYCIIKFGLQFFAKYYLKERVNKR